MGIFPNTVEGGTPLSYQSVHFQTIFFEVYVVCTRCTHLLRFASAWGKFENAQWRKDKNRIWDKKNGRLWRGVESPTNGFTVCRRLQPPPSLPLLSSTHEHEQIYKLSTLIKVIAHIVGTLGFADNYMNNLIDIYIIIPLWFFFFFIFKNSSPKFQIRIFL